MSKSKKVKKNSKTKKNMKGGRYSLEQQQQLFDMGFTQQFLQIVERAKIGFEFLLSNFEQSGLTAEQFMQQTYNDLELNPEEGFTDAEENDDDDEQDGGRRKKSKKRKTKKNKTKKQKHRIKKGGAMFGNGYGANCNDPNYSIYNTNLLKLFPYNPRIN
jgi:hypothetical protein